MANNWTQGIERFGANLAPILGAAAGTILGGPGAGTAVGTSIGQGAKQVLNSMANEQQGADLRNRIDNFDPRKTGLTDEQAAAQNLRSGQNAQDVSRLSDTNSVKDTAMELMRQNPGLDPVRAGKLAQDMADQSMRSQTQAYRDQQSFDDVSGSAKANRIAERGLVAAGVDIAAKNVADQLNNLAQARNSNNQLLLGARGQIG